MGCPLFRGFLSIEVNEAGLGLSELSVMSWVCAVERFPLSRVPLCMYLFRVQNNAKEQKWIDELVTDPLEPRH